MESATIEMQQYGRVQVAAAIDIGGMGLTREDITQRKDRKPSYGTVLNIGVASSVGLDFQGDTLDTAIMFRQPGGHPQPIRWRNDVVGSSSVVVEPKTGDFKFQGGNMDVGGHSLQATAGLSATDKPAANLRGIDLAVAQGQTTLEVKFDRPEVDASYAVSVTPSWLTQVAVSAKTTQGFTVQFGSAAPAAAKADWILVR